MHDSSLIVIHKSVTVHAYKRHVDKGECDLVHQNICEKLLDREVEALELERKTRSYDPSRCIILSNTIMLLWLPVSNQRHVLLRDLSLIYCGVLLLLLHYVHAV